MGFRTGEAELAIGEFAGTCTVSWKGRASGNRPSEQFTTLFAQLIEAEKRIEFDVSGLEHISSPTLVVLMRFIKQMEERGLDLELKYDDTIRWQRMTFEPLLKSSRASCKPVAEDRIPLAPVEWAPSGHAEGWS